MAKLKNTALLTPNELEKSFKRLIKGRKHAKVHEAVAQFCYDNDIVSHGTCLGYAKIKKISPNGTVILEVYPKLKFNIMNVELVK